FTSRGITHKRQWKFSEDKIFITDSVDEHHQCKAFLHFHPDANIKHNVDSVSAENFSVTFSNHKGLSIEDYDFAESFNKTVKAKVAVVLFSGRLDTEITL